MVKKLLLKTGLVVALISGVGLFASTNTSASAATVSRSQFNKDIQTVTTARNQGGDYVKYEIDAELISELKNDPVGAYRNDDDRGFGFVTESLAYELLSTYTTGQMDGVSAEIAQFNKNYTGAKTMYNGFKSRLSGSDRAILAQDLTDVNQYATNSDDIEDKASAAKNFANDLTSAINSYGHTVTKVASATSKSTITKLSAKKTATKKYVKITGKATLHQKANYARIKTYKGYRYAKLSQAGNFSKTIYAPKTKTVKVSAGYYANGHFSRVTANKTISVK